MVLKMKDTYGACLSAVPHVPHLAKFLMPFYKCWAGAKSQCSDTLTYCKIQLIAKSNLLHLTRSYLFIVKSTNQISRCFNQCARSRRAWPKPLCRWTSLHKMGTEFSFFFISAPLTPAPMPCWNSQLLQEQSPLSKLSHFDHSLLF